MTFVRPWAIRMFEWSRPVWILACLIQRLELDDRGAVVAADPERDRRRGVVDNDAADVGRVRQKIFDELPSLGIESRDAIAQHRAGPCLPVAVDDHVIRLA